MLLSLSDCMSAHGSLCRRVREHTPRSSRWVAGVGSWGLTLILAGLPQAPAVASPSPLPAELHADGRFGDAAIEYRRLGLNATTSEDRAGWFWMAADEYRHAALPDLAVAMLDKAESASGGIQREAVLLRGELALSARKWAEADFYFRASLPESDAGAGSDWRRYVARRSAVARAQAADVAGARAALAESTTVETNALAALDDYAAAPRKKPWLGGLLGLIPGLGYAYSGEYANGARSLILNSLFIFGMATTAREEQWGGFAAIGFFELTWYSGSIYGGLDAAHRYNAERLSGCTDRLMDRASFSPDPARVPVISLQFTF